MSDWDWNSFGIGLLTGVLGTLIAEAAALYFLKEELLSYAIRTIYEEVRKVVAG